MRREAALHSLLGGDGALQPRLPPWSHPAFKNGENLLPLFKNNSAGWSHAGPQSQIGLLLLLFPEAINLGVMG